MIRILLVDDHAVVREGYRHFLERSDDLRVVGEAADAAEGYDAWLRCAPDVTVVDLSMRDRGGLWLLGRIAARSPAARSLVFSMHEATRGSRTPTASCRPASRRRSAAATPSPA